jgi:hypothetical protein
VLFGLYLFFTTAVKGNARNQQTHYEYQETITRLFPESYGKHNAGKGNQENGQAPQGALLEGLNKQNKQANQKDNTTDDQGYSDWNFHGANTL